MKKFTNSTISILVAGAVVLGAGVYYQGICAKRVEEARQALRAIDRSHSDLDTAMLRADKYVYLLESMAESNMERQEPFSVASEFSPQEFKHIGSLLDTIYRRDGHFFLQRFELAWQHGKPERGLLPRVSLHLEGQKVLLFSDPGADTSSISVVKR